MHAISQRARAFTLIEVLVVLAIILVLAGLLLSSLARAKEQGRRAKCISNLKQIATAGKLFVNDNGGKLPWHTATSEGGTYGPDAAFVWKNAAALSNDLQAPQVLVCPSDSSAKMANTWTQFMSVAYQTNAMSFFVGLDGYDQLPIAILGGDRHITGGPAANCASVQVPPGVPAREYKTGNNNIRWDSAIHGRIGHLAFSDASVQSLNRKELKDIIDLAYHRLSDGTILSPSGKKTGNHFQLPR